MNFRWWENYYICFINSKINIVTKLINNEFAISDKLVLQPTNVNDLEVLFNFQLNEEAIYLAAFTPKDPTDKSA